MARPMKVYLQRPSLETDILWYFSVQIQRDLLGRWQVIREWGRSGSPGTLRHQPYDTLQEAIHSLETLRDELMSKGYRVVMQEGLKPALAAYLNQEIQRAKDS